MKQAIVTKYLAPTTFRGARIKATCNGGSIVSSFNHGLNESDNHSYVAHKLASDLGWLKLNDYIGGSLPKNAGYVFVAIERKRS